MSRSRKKPFIKDGYGSKWKRFAKRYSNRKIRRKLRNYEYELQDGMSYKNGPGLNRWDVCDYCFFVKKPKDRENWTRYGNYLSYEEELKLYQRATRK